MLTPTTVRRLFVALLPSEPVRAALVALAERMPRARWTPSGEAHLTLRFLGDVVENELPRVTAALARVRVAPFLLPTEGVGRFPPRGTPAVIWAGVGKGHPFLHRLRQQVDDSLLAGGVALKLTPFVPHFTVARVREAPPVQVEHWLKSHRNFVGPVWPVEAFHLMESRAGISGTEHRKLASFLLGGVPDAPCVAEAGRLGSARS
jgi:2'-5' RNA ligase